MPSASSSPTRSSSSPPTSVHLRAPSTLVTTPARVPLPSPSQLAGTWYVTHSSLPLWRDKRNVRITYTPSSTSNKIDDLVTYQTLSSAKEKTVHGTDTPTGHPCGYSWRGSGWLMVASSSWEILGWGRSQASEPGEEDDEWIVTYFTKTMFTPAGIDFYSRRKGGLNERTVKNLKEQLGVVNDLGRQEGNSDLGRMIQALFEVKHDDGI